MPSYAAFLGNHPSLSCAELSASIPDVSFTRMVGQSIMLFETALPLSQKQLAHWGGIFLLAKQINTGKASVKDVPQMLSKEIEGIKGKITFSLRAFGVPRPAIHDLYRTCKAALKKVGKPSRYIGNERKPPVSAQLIDSGVVEGRHGCEIVILADDEKKFFWVGRTVAVQNPDRYTKRDMEKPVRDTRAGLLPPKLAQMLLNYGAWMVHELKPEDKTKKPTQLTIQNAKLTVYDPFCGTGVIPMEALLKKWNVYASDISLKAVHGCEKNLEWIRKEEEILKRDVESVVWKQDATKPFGDPIKEKPQVIVTETMLGPPLSERPTVRDATKIRNECDATEIAFLENVAATLPGVPVVVTWPVWYLKTGPLFLEKVWKQLADIGFKAVLPKGVKADMPGRTSLVYRRPDQIVGREVVILKPLKK